MVGGPVPAVSGKARQRAAPKELDRGVRNLYGISMSRRRTVREIQTAAALLRRGGGRAPSDPIPDAANLARTATRLRVYERPLPLGIRGLLASTPHHQPALVVNARLPLVDRNVSAAHELGHWMLHGGSTVADATRSDRQRQEWEADRFARELLLPDEVLRRLLVEPRCSGQAAALRLGVRESFLLRRIRELRLADQPFFSSGSPVRGFSDTT